MSRIFYMLLASIIYLFFFATFLYLIAFVGDFPVLPKGVDHGGPPTPAGVALPVDIALIALFGIQHSVMARPGFKAWWTRIVPQPLERSIYVLAASLVLVLLFVLWRPIPDVVWRAEGTLAGIIWAIFFLGWLMVLSSTFLINHFELFGLAQPFRHMRNHVAAPPVLRQPLFYRFVRHPLYLGFLLALWAIPVMTLGHLVLAAGLSAYILIAIRYEERDLVEVFGNDYVAYRHQVGMLTPRFRRHVK